MLWQLIYNIFFMHVYIDNFDSLLYKRPTTTFVSDIWDAGYLQSYDFFSQRNRIALSLFCDGVPIYKSSKTSLWPIYFAVLNLHPSVCSLAKNIILAGVWVGPNKPPINDLLNLCARC